MGDRCTLKQGDCKNAFCNAKLPDNERTVVCPPVGDPAYHKDELWLLKKTLYGMLRSPCHCYNMVTLVLREIGLTSLVHDPCLYSGSLSPPANSTDPSL